MGPESEAKRQQIKLDLRSGGWAVLLGVFVALVFLGWRLALVVQYSDDPYSAPMVSVADYGFDLSNCLVPQDRIVAAAPPDALPPLDEPAMVPAWQIPAINRQHGKYLVPGDRVIGVVINEVARAYPLRVLNWHEVCNDTIGGVPIAVTYNPLCDSAVVFDRRVHGRAVRFAASGLLYNSNLLMYEPESPRGERSLWSQLQFRAIAGPAAGTDLEILPAQVAYWQDWERRHPETTVIQPNREQIKKYRREPYASYFGSERLRYPVAPLPTDSLSYKTDVVAVEMDGRRLVYALPEIARRAGERGRWGTMQHGVELRFDYRHIPPNPPTAWVHAADGAALPLVHAFWFAWHAMHPQKVAVAGQDDSVRAAPRGVITRETAERPRKLDITSGSPRM